MDVGLVTGVPQNHVARRIKDAVHRERQFDRTEVRAEMATSGGHGLDDESPDLLGQLGQLVVAEGLDIGRCLDAGKNHGDGEGYPDTARADLRSGRRNEMAATAKAATARTWRPRAGP